MSLNPGDRLSQYEILEAIGAGGMGEVYRARDTRLDRDVAIKVLPDEFSRDRDRLARFEREAKLLAQLNHPNIATLHGLEEAHGQKFIVMELIEGETLAERIVSGPIPIDEAILLFQQIATGLSVAHEKGIVHRDLKPANIKIGPDGTPKILDFGLAKAFAGEDARSAGSSQSPTLTKATALGVIIGTASYMSPEQARGKTVDKRTDIWALGCCLYEALTGSRAFVGETVTDTLAAVVRAEPRLERLPRETPSLCRVLIGRCLEKDLKNRLHDAADANVLLQESAHADPPVGVTRTTTAWPRIAAALLVGCALGALFVALISPRGGDDAPRLVTEFSVLRPELDRMYQYHREAPAIALSPDGSMLAYVATDSDESMVFLRELGKRGARAIPQTEGATSVFFSPDGEWIGFTASSNKLKKVAVSGQAPVTLADAADGYGASWGVDGMIVYAQPGGRSLTEIPAAGGTPQPITTIETSESSHRFPVHLPGDRGVLFTSRSFDFSTTSIMVKPTNGEPKLLIEGGTSARYAPTGHLIYGQRGALVAVRFDLERLEVIGDPATVLESVQQYRGLATQFSISEDGTLAYVPGSSAEHDRTLTWVDRTGSEEILPVPARPYSQPRLSPSGTQVAMGIDDADRDVWIYDVENGALRRLTFGGSDGFPVWTPDGRHVVFQSNRAGVPAVYWKPSDGGGPAERLAVTETYDMPHSFTPDGNKLALVQAHPETATDISWLDMTDREQTHEYLKTAGFENSPMFSPDGRFLAYRTEESGRGEIYVQPFPMTGAKWQVSTGGGSEVVWAHDGRELYYRNATKFMAVDISLDPVFSAGKPRILFEAEYERTVPDRANYDVDNNGERFLVVKASGDVQPSREIVITLNWAETLKTTLPAPR